MAQCSRPKCTHPARKPLVVTSRQRYCLRHHAESMRKHRKTHPLTMAARVKMRARSMANTHLRRGKIKRKPCENCGSKKAQMHHEDYSKPLEVRWLCRRCHVQHHYAPAGLDVDQPSPSMKTVDSARKSGLSRPLEELALQGSL